MIEDNKYPAGKIISKQFKKGWIFRSYNLSPHLVGGFILTVGGDAFSVTNKSLLGCMRFKVYKDGIMFFNRPGDRHVKLQK